MLKSVRFGFMLLDFIGQFFLEITQCKQNSFHADLLLFCCYLFVSKEKKGCNVLIVLFTGSCVGGSSRKLKTCKGSWIVVWAMLSGCHVGQIKCSFSL